MWEVQGRYICSSIAFVFITWLVLSNNPLNLEGSRSYSIPFNLTHTEDRASGATFVFPNETSSSDMMYSVSNMFTDRLKHAYEKKKGKWGH